MVSKDGHVYMHVYMHVRNGTHAHLADLQALPHGHP